MYEYTLLISRNFTHSVFGNQAKDELFLLPVDGSAQRLDPDFVGSITVAPTSTGFFATFVNYNTPGLIKRLDWAHPGAEASWKVWRDTKFEAFPLDDFITTQVRSAACNCTIFLPHTHCKKIEDVVPK